MKLSPYAQAMDKLKHTRPTTDISYWQHVYKLLMQDYTDLIKQKAAYIVKLENEKSVDLTDLSPKEFKRLNNRIIHQEKELNIIYSAKFLFDMMMEVYLDTTTKLTEYYDKKLVNIMYDVDQMYKELRFTKQALKDAHQTEIFMNELALKLANQILEIEKKD